MILRKILPWIILTFAFAAFWGCRSKEDLWSHAGINYQALLQHTPFYDFIEDSRVTDVQAQGKDENGKMVYDVWTTVTFNRNFDLSNPDAIAEALKLESPVYDWVDEYYRYYHVAIRVKEGIKTYFYDFTK